MAQKRSAVKEVKEELKVEAQPEHDDLITRVYLVKKTGYEMLEGLDARAEINAIQAAAKKSEDGDTPYIFYESGRPVYLAVKNGYLRPLAFPEPGSDPTKGQAGMTSMELYGLAVTLPSTIERIIELETEPKPSLLDQARKIMTPTLVIVASILAIFLILVTMTG